MVEEILAPVLFLYFVHAFELGLFPKIFKTAKLIPIFKSGNKQNIQNYCPISLLPSLSKFLEKLIKNRLINFFDKYEIIYDYQYEFRENRSVVHRLLDVSVQTLDAIQNKQHTALLLMDIRKAFDTVSHNIVLQKLYHYGIREFALKLLESYLASRSQFVTVRNCNSSLKSINVGIPQSSILGLLLFLLYINDMPNATSCNSRLFADDTCLIVCNSTLSGLKHECNREMQNLCKWSCANEL